MLPSGLKNLKTRRGDLERTFLVPRHITVQPEKLADPFFDRERLVALMPFERRLNGKVCTYQLAFTLFWVGMTVNRKLSRTSNNLLMHRESRVV